MKKTATILVIATILVGATYFLFQPKDIISDPKLLDIVRVVSYSGGEGYEINGTYMDKSLHILVGDLNVVYESSDRGGFGIIDSSRLLAEIELLTKP